MCQPEALPFPQVLWGDALLRVEEGLNAGRRWLWDEASRKVGTLIAAPSAFQGEHFLQVGHPSATCPAAWPHHSMRILSVRAFRQPALSSRAPPSSIP